MWAPLRSEVERNWWACDLPSTTSRRTWIRLFADDCLIYHPIRNSQDQVTLQRDLNDLIRWSKQWGMQFNAAKCKVMRTTGGIKSHRFYHMDEQIPQEVQKATYLIVRELTGVPVHHLPWSSVSGTILFRGLSGIILAMLPEKNWESLLISAIFQNGRCKIWDFQYHGL